MLTKAAKIIFGTVYGSGINNAMIPPVTLPSSSSQKIGYIKGKDTTGNERFWCGGSSYSTWAMIKTMTDGNGGCVIGSGDSPATDEDYTLESQITTGFTAGSPQYYCEFDSVNNQYHARVQYTINNTGSEDLVVKEIGYYRGMDYSNTLGGLRAGSSHILLDRTVLNEPVVITPGTPGVVNYDFIYPTNEPEPEPEPGE